MVVGSSMESYVARLASFNAVHQATRKRASNAKGAKTLKWPHKNPSPPQLARAGFFYQPTSSCPDNTTCYLCQSNLDGWEEDDDAVEEHLKHAPNCGWAVTVAIEQDIENGGYSLEDPMSEKVLDARRMTFGSKWPHENKRGWTCKTQKMIDAGWHYCPTLESDDFVKCSYCNLSLDGWEPKDIPHDEHQRRSPDCSFFALYASIKAKPARSKKARTSKASRMSTQSNFTAVSEGISLVETEANLDETVMSSVDPAKPTKATRGSKKAPKDKKSTSRAKVKGVKKMQEEPQMASSFQDAEDDDFEVKIAQVPETVSSNKKRKSEEISSNNEDENQPSVITTDEEPPLPAKKRRTTRAASSVARAPGVPISAPRGENEVNTHMTEVEDMPPPSAPASKKNGKGNKERASSITRKASTASTASKASLRNRTSNDEEIDAALEAELNRPLTDDENEAEPLEVKQPKGRRLTRNKPVPKKATASVAPTRRGTRASSVTIDDSSMTNVYPPIPSASEPEAAAERRVEVERTNESVAEPPLKTKKQKGKVSHKVSAKQQDQRQDTGPLDKSNAAVDEKEVNEDAAVVTLQQSESREASRQFLARNTRASNISAANAPVDLASDMNISMLDTQTAQDDSGHETDASVMKQSRAKRGSKKVPAKKGKGGKKAALTDRNIEDIVQTSASDPPTAEIENAMATVSIDRPDSAEPDLVEVEIPEKRVNATKATGKPPKAKGKEAKTNVMAEKALVASSPEQPNIVVEIEDTPASPQLPSVHSTPQPAPSSQSSDAENQPPSSRPSIVRPPLDMQSPSRSKMTRVPLAATTPTTSPSRGKFSKLKSLFPWAAVDLDQIFHDTPANKEKDRFVFGNATGSMKDVLTSPEKKLSVEQWIQFHAQRGEEKLRNECERLVGRFEGEGVRALKTLEGIACAP